MLNRAYHTVLLAGLALLFGTALGWLLHLRYQAGDVFPVYSSLRADPLGARALFEAFEVTPGFTVERNYRPVPQLELPPETTLLHLGISSEALDRVSPALAESWDQLLEAGGRLVFTFRPEDFQSKTLSTAREKSTEALDQTGPWFAPVDVRERWEVTWRRERLPLESDGTVRAKRTQGSAEPTDEPAPAVEPDDLPPSLRWHSAWVFEPGHAGWETVYAVGEFPVVIRRNVGPGTLVLATDSYPLSNEALLEQRQTRYVAWLLGDKPRLIFDEAHLGVSRSPGVAGLLRSYDLEFFLLALVALGLLHVWSQRPLSRPDQPSSTEADGEMLAGKDSASGLVNLLRRSIPPRELPRVCLDHWRADCLPRRRSLALKARQLETLLAAASAPGQTPDSAGLYTQMAALAAEQKNAPHATSR